MRCKKIIRMPFNTAKQMKPGYIKPHAQLTV